MNLVLESLYETEVVLGGALVGVRVWREAEVLHEPQKKLGWLEDQLKEIGATSTTAYQLAARITKEVADVSAVQVKVGRESVLLYVDWP